MAILILILFAAGSTEIDETLAQLHLDTGMAYLNQGLTEQAEQEFTESLELSPDCAVAILGLGLVYIERESWNLAESYFLEYIEACPDNYLGYEKLAELFLQNHAPAEAAAMADSAFNRAPTIPSIWLLCGETSIAVADTSAAEFWLVKCLDESDVRFEASVLLASIYLCTSRDHEARNILFPVAESGYSPALWGLAKVYLKWSDYQRAVTSIHQYLYLAPDGVHADSCRIVLDDLAESGRYFPED